METDERFMREALREAAAARDDDEIPVGAVVVWKGRVIAKGHNMVERLHDPTAHAEMIALTAATEAVGGKYLNECTLYVTLEPCPMCAGAIINSRIKTVYFGAYDNKAGSFGSVADFNRIPYNHKPEIIAGVMEKECSELLSNFFKNLRKKNAAD